MRTIELPSGERVPVLGQGTWRMAERKRRRADEIASLRLGIDLGMTLIDTAEMYASGGAEELLGEAIAGRRDELFLVSKVLPHNASLRGTLDACAASLRRLGTDRLDLYLLHWRGGHPLADTVQAMEILRERGDIRYWGVSNFDVADLEELDEVADGNQVDQVLYNLTRRGVEYDLLPWCARRGLPIMAYSPIEQGRMLGHAALREVAERTGATPAQVGLAWVLRNDGVLTIPCSGDPAHVRENREALSLRLSEADLATLDKAFRPPESAVRLEVL
jgi:diketogulonate reductase-like aldo/keto reductase